MLLSGVAQLAKSATKLSWKSCRKEGWCVARMRFQASLEILLLHQTCYMPVRNTSNEINVYNSSNILIVFQFGVY